LPTQDDKKAPFSLSINVLLILCFGLVACLPVTIFGIKVYNAAWDNAWREVREKHQLLAENLANPISIYVKNQKAVLALTGEHLRIRELLQKPNKEATEHLLYESLLYSEGLTALFLLDNTQYVLNHITEYRPRQVLKDNMFTHHTFVGKALHHQTSVSPVRINPLTGQPSVFIATPLYSGAGVPSHILVGELKLEPIEKLRAAIRFGKAGHSAIVDNLGQVLAHPNPDWMKTQIKSLSNLDIVQKMMAGKTGVTEFFSPFVKSHMVAGYTSVPELGWGIMVPQPKTEMQAQVRTILYAEFRWALMGLLLAIVTAIYLGRWITSPLNKLAKAAQKLASDGFKHNLPETLSAPKEIQQLAKTFRDAIQGLSHSRAEIQKLNEGLQHKIDAATHNLQQANEQLNELARSDHLTGLANRYHFEQTIAKLCSRRQGDRDRASLLLLDLDHFKQINDTYGHAAGDMALSKVARILDHNMRQSDLAARYAGDEFILLIRADEKIARERADNILAEIAAEKFQFENQSLSVTVSIGLYSFDISSPGLDLKTLFTKVDEAMYQAKNSGRNKVMVLGQN